ncbi:Methylcytosine dioxygenase TET1 [Geodia barretti]|uniref:Methylcytosine dioxygenase TET n=1 Tax=Geodia barretti TaxID=519541 RepID=A0AA35TJG5_GEOBA|nr:Methylcytosine dioxygenase TET1 [Geodia barretti]
MASSGVIPLPPPPYPSIHYGPKPPWPRNGSLALLQKTGFLSPLRPGDQPPEKAEPLSPPPPTPGESPGAGTTSGESQSPLMTKKPKRTRRKRCEKCEGCRTKDNCGRCSVCTNPNSTNSICKHRRCEVLTRRRPSGSLQTPLSGVQRNLFSASSPLFPPEGLNGFRPSSSPFASPFASPFLSPFSLGPPVFSSLHQRERPPTPVKDPPPRRRKQASSYQPYKTPIKDPPPCGCPGSDEGFYYTHLGAAESPEALREMMENRFSVTGKQLRLLEISFTGIEAKTSEGCPTAEWIIRRPSKEELFLGLYRRHKGHHCSKIYTVVSIVLWEGISQPRAEQIYNHLTSTLPKYGMPTNRRCATNETKSCACQGTDLNTQGASYSFGCSWSVYYNGCKFGRSKIPRKFRLLDETQELPLENLIQTLASDLGPVYKWLAPDSYTNQVATQKAGQECRLGNGPEGEERPFSGITCCMDFCAHSHYDRQNMVHGGATVVCTILKKGVLQQEHSEDSEQLHVLPLYRLTNPPAESVDGIEVRPVESLIKPSPNPSRAPTPLTTTTTVTPHSSLPPHLLPHHPSSSLSSSGGRVKRELAEEAVLPSPGRAPQPHPPATPTTTLSHDLSTSVSSPAETPPRASSTRWQHDIVIE